MKVIKIYESCRVIKGYQRSVIYDLEKNKYFLIPNLMHDLIVKYDGCSIEEIYDKFEDKLLIDEYINYLIENNLCFFCDEKDISFFTKLNIKWESPSLITNAIVIIGDKNLNLRDIFYQIEQNLCKHILIFSKRIECIKELCLLLENSIIKSLDIVLPYENEEQENLLLRIINKHTRIKNIIIYSAKEERKLYFNKILGQQIISTKKNNVIDNCMFNRFIINLPFFTESQSYNTCLNRKICIDEEGNIKNCPAIKNSYGNIKNITLEEAMNKDGFKNLWHINKDSIDVCRDCEFRYMCSDCRAFIKYPDNIYSQPSKCTYNPYVCLWDGQEGYIPVEECGIYIKEKGFIPDKEKIEEFNKQIWGE